jgi:hypothetical protein
MLVRPSRDALERHEKATASGVRENTSSIGDASALHGGTPLTKAAACCAERRGRALPSPV